MRSSRLLRAVASRTTAKDYCISRLDTGLRVISRDDGSGVTGIGIFTSAGPANESSGTYGSSAIVESLPLSGNQIHSANEITAFMERSGNVFKVINVKECLGMMVMVPRYHTEDALELLTGMALYPSQSEDLFTHAKSNLHLVAEELQRDATRTCFEQTYTAGWGKNAVGVPQVPDAAELEKLTQAGYLGFHRTFTRPETTVVAATGVDDHDAFVRHVEDIVRFDTTPEAPPTVNAKFVGGAVFSHTLEAPESRVKFEEKNLTHISLCLPINSMSNSDYYTYSVLQTLMGGGTSFSSGGPGKGLHTKLFREVIDREGWIHGIESITGWFKCGGLLGLYGSCPHDWNAHLYRAMMQQLASMSQRVTEEQVEMAKNHLMSQLVLLGEARETVLEEMGKNLLLHDHVTTADELLAGARGVTLEGLHQACKKAVVGNNLAFSVFGNTDKLPTVEVANNQLQTLFRNLNPKLVQN